MELALETLHLLLLFMIIIIVHHPLCDNEESDQHLVVTSPLTKLPQDADHPPRYRRGDGEQ